MQEAALRAAGCTSFVREKSGTSEQGRAELEILLAILQEGNTLMVIGIDRLARSVGDLQDIVKALKEKGVALKATEQPVDTSSDAGKAFLDMLGVFAEVETNLCQERQMEGMAAATRGVYKGRRLTINADEIHKLKAEGVGPAEIARRLGIGRASVYRAGSNLTENLLSACRQYQSRTRFEFCDRLCDKILLNFQGRPTCRLSRNAATPSHLPHHHTTMIKSCSM